MSERNWWIAGGGLVLAVVGGIAEAHHILVLGGVSGVVGLVCWIVFSGSSLPTEDEPF